MKLPPRLRARRRRDKVWYYYDCGGRNPRREIALGSDYAAALHKWAELEAEPYASASARITFPDLWNQYAADVLPTLKAGTIRTHRSDIKRLLAFFGDPPAPLDEIRPVHIRQFLDMNKEFATTANRCKRLFSVLFNYARAKGWTERENPCLGIKGFAHGHRDVYITDDIFSAVLSCADDPTKRAMRLAYLTGQRPADVIMMRYEDIIDGTLPVQQGKTGARIRIEISGELAELLADGSGSGYILTKGRKPMSRMILRNGFVAARAEAAQRYPELAEQIKKFWFYDLRAKAADDKADSSGEAEAQRLLGHTDIRTTSRHYLRRGKIVTPTK